MRSNNVILTIMIVVYRSDLRDFMKFIVQKGKIIRLQILFLILFDRLPKIEKEAFDWREDPHHLMEQVISYLFFMILMITLQ